MRLRVFSPTDEVVDSQVTRVSVQAVGGGFTMLPRHLDTAAVLEPGLLAFGLPDGTEVFVAVDGGTVVKVGEDVLVSTPTAISGRDLDELRPAIEEALLARWRHEEAGRMALARLEVDVIERMVTLEESSSP